jgi:RING finger protein 113A
MSEIKVPFFKKGKSRPTTSRKRSSSPPHISAPTPSSSSSQVIHPSRKQTGNLLSAGTKRTAAQRREDEIADPDFVERDGPAVKWTAAGSHTNAALEILAGDEAAELLAKRQKKEKADRGEEEEEIPDDGLYRGQNAYRSHLKKSQEVPKAMRVGPQRGTSTIRTVTIVDYQPDVCKDYKGAQALFRWIRILK